MPRTLRTLGSLLAIAGALGACTYTSRAIDPPDAQEIESSTLYSSDGTLVHTFHAEENRKVVPLEQIPAHVREAVIAIEDERFYRHNGVDPRAILRAARTNVEAGATEQGGSTITQQYVKQEILEDDSPTFERKLQEASTAIQLERRYSKDRILELYLNAIYFGNGAYGIEAAAHQYFGIPATDLNVQQGALLAGLIQRPSATDPYDHPEAAVARRTLVLQRMAANDMLSPLEAYAAGVQPLQLASGIVPAAERYPAAYFVEEVKQWLLDDPRFGATPQARRDLLFGGGLRIQTTVDLEMQAQAEAAVAAILPDPNGPDASLVSIEAATGYVRAMVGGRDFFGTSPIAKLNLATQGPRQAGSAFKPLVLATALTQGIDPLYPHLGPVLHHDPLGRGRQAVAPVQLRRGRRRHRHHRRGHGAVVQHPLRPAGDARRRQGGHGGRHAIRDHEPARERAVRRAGQQRRHRDGHGRGLLHLRQPRHQGAAGAGHPDHACRRHRAVHPAAPPDRRSSKRGWWTRSRASSSR